MTNPYEDQDPYGTAWRHGYVHGLENPGDITVDAPDFSSWALDEETTRYLAQVWLEGATAGREESGGAPGEHDDEAERLTSEAVTVLAAIQLHGTLLTVWATATTLEGDTTVALTQWDAMLTDMVTQADPLQRALSDRRDDPDARSLAEQLRAEPAQVAADGPAEVSVTVSLDDGAQLDLSVPTASRDTVVADVLHAFHEAQAAIESRSGDIGDQVLDDESQSMTEP